MLITVYRRDIWLAKLSRALNQNTSKTCPLARAIRRKFKHSQVRVLFDNVKIDEQRHPLSEQAIGIIRLFDDRLPMYPPYTFSFDPNQVSTTE